MRRMLLVTTAAIAVASLHGAVAEEPPKAQSRPTPSPGAAPPSESQQAASDRAAGRGVALQPTAKPKNLKTLVAEFRALDLDRKTVSFETDDGKSYTVPAQVPGMEQAQERAERLAQALKPGDRIRMLCRIDQDEQPTLVLSLHMVGNKAPMEFR